MSDAIQHLFNRLTVLDGYPDALLGGIYANKPGYHNKRDNLPSSDESCQGPDNQTGPGNLAAGLDVTMHNPADMQRMTQRLIDLTYAGDARVQVLAYFLGTVDGRNVTGMDVRGRYWITSDDSHLWHEHLSIYRRWAGDHAAMDALADAILDTDHHPPEDDMTDEQWQFLQNMNLKLDAIQHHQIYTEAWKCWTRDPDPTSAGIVQPDRLDLERRRGVHPADRATEPGRHDRRTVLESGRDHGAD